MAVTADKTRLRPSPTSPATLVACLVAAWCALALACALTPCTAWAEDIDTDPQPDDLQQRVERTAKAYDEAVAKVEALNADIEQNSKLIAKLEKQIPLQRERSSAAARELYKIQNQQFSFIEFLLTAADLPDFLKMLEYASHVTDSNLQEMARLQSMMDELQTSRDQLEKDKAEADAQVTQAETALREAQAARLEAQRRAEEEARRQAEAAAAAAAAAQAASERDAAPQGGESSQPAAPAPAPAPAEIDATPTVEPDGADWTSDEATFINQWAPRIDAYLAGSPLYGYGVNFAQAAWDYGVDPRFSPAISMVESSKGAVCFLPHNAWGWGSVSWDSWEEAIDAHVRGLARGYGYTVTPEGAAKYCPPNATHWYNRVVEEMSYI